MPRTCSQASARSSAGLETLPHLVQTSDCLHSFPLASSRKLSKLCHHTFWSPPQDTAPLMAWGHTARLCSDPVLPFWSCPLWYSRHRSLGASPSSPHHGCTKPVVRVLPCRPFFSCWLGSLFPCSLPLRVITLPCPPPCTMPLSFHSLSASLGPSAESRCWCGPRAVATWGQGPRELKEAVRACRRQPFRVPEASGGPRVLSLPPPISPRTDPGPAAVPRSASTRGPADAEQILR